MRSISMSIYPSQEFPFVPTYLYIKQHSITGKLYFGKTVKNPLKYNGSGKHWKSHIKAHGKSHVETLWYCLFHDEDNIKEFSLNFSKEQNIVESNLWLNLIPENGLDGSSPGSKLATPRKKKSKEDCLKISIALKGRTRPPFSDEHKLNISKTKIGIIRTPFSDEHKLKMSISASKPKNIITCPHCNLSGSARNMNVYHFDNCKLKPDTTSMNITTNK